ncbi:N-acetylmuramoyl-L-alanine amidase [Sporosarcina pasteurii]|uniref:N-acetylmuramoyl-L-alanine amidase n=1 Tax=Sporosarcina pasteurii TaxID=1474 RepID=UPI002443FE5E|nr:N-acetylmuramoyl-L-alanine amidase [Sporosarcina pasteurii]MDS9471369.1 peptidoglycan-binding protein [Sporosarcina pasteurii]
MRIKKQFVTSRKNTFPGTNGRKFITIHETANYSRGAGAQMHANLQSSGFSASWHWQVDDKVAIQSFPHTVRCWHAGDGVGNGNYQSIAIEICVNVDGDFRQAVVNAVALVKKIMRDEGIPINNVVQHNHWSGKDCPHHLRKGDKGINWATFKRLIQTTAELATSNLSFGSRGEAVKQLQTDLNKLGYKLTVDRIYGPQTQKALKEALARQTASSVKIVKYGDKGEAVKRLQTDLNKFGYKLTVDSSFGPATERAVKAFQSSQKLTADGIVGPKTQKALKAEPVKQPIRKKILRFGDQGEDVRAMQAALASISFYPDKGAKNNGVDGYFGPKTLDAVKRFQSVYTPTEVDGIFGPKTQDALNKAIKNN